MPLHDVLKQEFIGTDIEVTDAQNKGTIGLKGRVVDETKNMLVIEHHGKVKRLIKDHVTVRITMKGKTYEINGKLLVGRPEDRLKKRFKW